MTHEDSDTDREITWYIELYTNEIVIYVHGHNAHTSASEVRAV